MATKYILSKENECAYISIMEDDTLQVKFRVFMDTSLIEETASFDNIADLTQVTEIEYSEEELEETFHIPSFASITIGKSDDALVPN